MISVDKLAKSYGPVQALKGISFEVRKGEIIGLLGPNGAGKTTTMKIVTGYLQPSEGTARVDGIDVVEDPVGVQKLIGYLPENAPLYLDMLVQEYLKMVADLREIPPERQRAHIAEAVTATGLKEHLTRPIGDLSKGFRQRVGLAQAIMHKPRLLILDEPTNGLDPTQIVEIRNLITRLAQASTVILSTHILPEVEATCHRAIIMMNGEIRADAKLDDLRSSSNDYVAVNSDATGVLEALSGLEGVNQVTEEAQVGGSFTRYRVVGQRDVDLCPSIYDLARSRSWRLKELRHEQRTLESVFRELAERQGVAA
ncbi:MAG: ATP-binding cassette domain-containing protein [Deltaproteobacteria bacterium]|nr:ATP-binding cassette domain-containing protein [Deltaproteobacteria bacterium]